MLCILQLYDRGDLQALICLAPYFNALYSSSCTVANAVQSLMVAIWTLLQVLFGWWPLIYYLSTMGPLLTYLCPQLHFFQNKKQLIFAFVLFIFNPTLVLIRDLRRSVTNLAMLIVYFVIDGRFGDNKYTYLLCVCVKILS